MILRPDHRHPGGKPRTAPPEVHNEQKLGSKQWKWRISSGPIGAKPWKWSPKAFFFVHWGNLLLIEMWVGHGMFQNMGFWNVPSSVGTKQENQGPKFWSWFRIYQLDAEYCYSTIYILHQIPKKITSQSYCPFPQKWVIPINRSR